MVAVKALLARFPGAVVRQMASGIAFWLVLAASDSSVVAGADNGAVSAIQTLLQTSAGYWNAGRLDDFMKSYENSASTTYVSSKSILHGYDAIRAHYAAAYGGHSGTLSFSNLAVRPLGNDYAVVVARWHLAMRDGARPSGIFSLVLHRDSVGWRIITDHSP